MKPSMEALGDCENDCAVFVGVPVKVGRFTFQVRRADGETGRYEVWRCGVELGSFVLANDGTSHVLPRTAFSVDRVLLSLVADAYREPSCG